MGWRILIPHDDQVILFPHDDNCIWGIFHMPPWPDFLPWPCLDSQLPSNTELSLFCHNDESGRTLRLRTTCINHQTMGGSLLLYFGLEHIWLVWNHQRFRKWCNGGFGAYSRDHHHCMLFDKLLWNTQLAISCCDMVLNFFSTTNPQILLWALIKFDYSLSRSFLCESRALPPNSAIKRRRTVN